MNGRPFGSDDADPALTSYEGRWFFDGDVPAAVERAFRESTREGRDAGHGGGWPPPRTDHYLPFAPDMGMKLRVEPGRPPRLELKGRLRPNAPVDLAPGVVAVVSTWSKWSYPAERVPGSLLEALRPGGPAIPVRKSRLLRWFRLTPGETPREVSPAERLDRGVQLELTRLSVGAPGGEVASWEGWTLGFEGFPVSEGLEAAVHAALAAPLAALSAGGAALDEVHSASYPAWLSSLGRGSSPSP